MKIIVPMAGRGSRLRPHTLTIPKPLIPIAGKPIVQRLVEDIAKISTEKITEIAFIIGDFGDAVEEKLQDIAKNIGAKCSIYHQENPMGTAHAILCAKDSLEGPCVVAFADTLFKADFTLDNNIDGVVWVKSVKDPSAFGVVKLDDKGVITDFVEKPEKYISDLAIIGVYYFKDGENLRNELQYLLDNDIIKGGEYQLTDALENMKNKGLKLQTGKVNDWMDCGNKKVTVETNTKILEYKHNEGDDLVSSSAKIINSTVIPPCQIGDNVEIKNSIVGPFVSVGDNTKITNCNINNSLIQKDSEIVNACLIDSMIGNHARYKGIKRSISLGDYSALDF